MAGSPGTVFIMSVDWPPFALSALKASACEAQARLREDALPKKISNYMHIVLKLFGGSR